MADAGDGAGDADGPRQSLAEVRSVYDEIGTHFAKTRAHPWAEIESFLEDREGRVGLDVGCGNGRHLEVLARHVQQPVGLDLSETLLRTATDRLEAAGARADLLQGDAGSVPIRTDSVDLALYVATVHHLPTRSARRASLDELARVLAPEGRALVSAWSTTHDRFDVAGDDETGFDTTVDWTLEDGSTVPRYYHIYAPPEFEADLASSALSVETTFVSSGNCFGVVRD